MKPLFLERLVARAFLASRNPIRGKELQFLRKTAQLSLEKLARNLGLTASGVYYWEKASEVRLMIVNELAVRIFFAEAFGVEVSARFSDLIGLPASEIISLEISKARKSYKPRKKDTTKLPGFKPKSSHS